MSRTIRTPFYACSLILIAALTSCSGVRETQQINDQDESQAKHYVELLRQGQFKAIEQDLDESLESEPDAEGSLSEAAKQLPAGDPLSIKRVGASVLVRPTSTQSTIELEYEFPEKWIEADLVFLRKDGATKILVFRVGNLKTSLEQYNSFAFASKDLDHYIVFFMGLLSMAISVFAFAQCLKTKIRRAKWLWAVGTLIGMCRFGINWTTGDLIFRPFYFQVPVMTWSKALYGPWIISTCLPVGAILFLLLRTSLISAKRESVASHVITLTNPN